MRSFLLALVALSVGLALTASAEEPLATLDGEPIFESDLTVSVEQRKAERQLYQLKAQALEATVRRRMMEIEAKKREITVDELIAAEITPKIGAPTDKEIGDFYKTNQARIGKPLKEVREQIANGLRTAKANEHFSDLIRTLREQHELVVMLEPPRLPVDLTDVRSVGPEDAKVTFVEYLDFQCPYCRDSDKDLAALREENKDKVRFVFKDLPLVQLHPEAMRAAKAARCADDMGKFWEYRAKLFENDLFTDSMYKSIAEEVGLDADELIACVDSDKHDAAIQKDAGEAGSFGIDGTPAYIVDGVLVIGARSADVLQQMIDQAFERLEREI